MVEYLAFGTWPDLISSSLHESVESAIKFHLKSQSASLPLWIGDEAEIAAKIGVKGRRVSCKKQACS